MKKIIVIPVLAALLLIPTFFMTSCTCEQFTALADLLSESGILGPTNVQTGTQYSFELDALNKEDVPPNECSITDIAGATLCYVNLVKDGISILSGDKNMPSLDPNEITKLISSIVFNQPGTYDLEFFLDHPLEVPERNENNQSYGWPGRIDRLEMLRQTNNYYHLTITVSENPNYHPKDLTWHAKFVN